MKEVGYGIPLQDGTTIKINAAAYADDLILCPDTHEHMEIVLALLGQFCSYAKMKVNAEKCVSLSQVWNGAKADKDPDPFYIHTEKGAEEIPTEIVSIYLGMPIGFNKYENMKHGQEVLASMMEDVKNVWRSRLKIVQKMHALKTFVFPRIDYRMMCADITKTSINGWIQEREHDTSPSEPDSICEVIDVRRVQVDDRSSRKDHEGRSPEKGVTGVPRTSGYSTRNDSSEGGLNGGLLSDICA
jgi:hypothetical protein